MKTAKSSWGLGRVKFLEKFSLIEKAKADGWPVTMIYRQYKDDLNITYAQFARYVQHYITGANTKIDRATESETVPSSEKKVPLSNPPKLSSFDYQPSPDRNKLI